MTARLADHEMRRKRPASFVGKGMMLALPSGCWLWLRTQNGVRYGHWKTDGEIRAHRAMYTIFSGPIPDGLELDHLCKQTLCVNPPHLEAVPQAVNNMRSNSPSAVNARKTHCRRGHPYAAPHLFMNHGKRYCRTCQRKGGTP